MKLDVFKLNENATIPAKATEKSSCYDLESCLHTETVKVYVKGGVQERRVETNGDDKYITIFSGERVLVPTGLVFDIPDTHDMKVYPRSGLSLKNGITLANCTGVIDSDYKEELYVIVYNNSLDTYYLSDKSRIAQFELTKKELFDISEVKKKPSKTTDRNGGLGSTGVKKTTSTKKAKATTTATQLDTKE